MSSTHWWVPTRGVNGDLYFEGGCHINGIVKGSVSADGDSEGGFEYFRRTARLKAASMCLMSCYTASSVATSMRINV